MQERFYYLFHKYEKETCFLSFHNREHHAYQEILAMGKSITPLLIANLWNGWISSCLLFDFYGDILDIHKDDYGKYDVINQAWYDWAIKNNYFVEVK